MASFLVLAYFGLDNSFDPKPVNPPWVKTHLDESRGIPGLVFFVSWHSWQVAYFSNFTLRKDFQKWFRTGSGHNPGSRLKGSSSGL